MPSIVDPRYFIIYTAFMNGVFLKLHSPSLRNRVNSHLPISCPATLLTPVWSGPRFPPPHRANLRPEHQWPPCWLTPRPAPILRISEPSRVCVTTAYTFPPDRSSHGFQEGTPPLPLLVTQLGWRLTVFPKIAVNPVPKIGLKTYQNCFHFSSFSFCVYINSIASIVNFKLYNFLISA